MGWLLILLAIIVVVRLASAIAIHPFGLRGFGGRIDTVLGGRLDAMGFSKTTLATTDQGDLKNSIRYRNDRFELAFIWDRQQLFVELSPLDCSILPTDPTLPRPTLDSHNHSPPYDVWEMLSYLGIVSDVSPYTLSNRRLINNVLEFLKSELPNLRPFLFGDLKIFVPYRRHLEIRQLKYSWDMRESYKDSETFELETITKIRSYADAWWQDEDYVSVVNVLSIIESRLTEDEARRLRVARERTGLAG